MAARSIGSGTISFGLVAIPVRLYVATHSESLSFNMLHEPCGTRIKQQLFCPHCEQVVERREIVKGYQFERDRYVTFTDEEIKALETEVNRSIDIHEFVPLEKVDPLYYESANYLGPDKGGEKAYRLLVDAMRDTERGAVAQFASRGKEHMVLIRPFEDGLVMHVLHYADEVRPIGELPLDQGAPVRPAEIELARKLIAELSTDEFRPVEYKDTYRERVEAAVQKKIAGEEIRVSEDAAPAAGQVIDLVQALKESLARRGAKGERRAASAPAEEPKRAAAGGEKRAARGGGGRGKTAEASGRRTRGKK
jgi:DNA end-binding protein Ku